MSPVDVVVVSYNSRAQLRRCVEPLLGEANVIVVDNASPDRSLEAVADLPVRAPQLATKDGFGAGCNAGWRAGSAPYVLFLNPDATIDGDSLRRLVRIVEEDEGAGGAAPRILNSDGTLDFSLRRFPRLRSTYAQALFLHRLFPRASWTDEVVRDSEAYASPAWPDWVRSEEHTSELQSRQYLVCRLLLEKKK